MKLFIGLLLLASLIVAPGCGTNDATTVDKEPMISVLATKVIRDDIVSFINTTGTIFPKQESMISPKTSGRIEKLYVDEGDKVKKGQPLVELEQEWLLFITAERDFMNAFFKPHDPFRTGGVTEQGAVLHGLFRVGKGHYIKQGTVLENVQR